MTLGLLRMADVNHLSILLGKSTSRLVNAMLLLAAQFPFTLLAITLGGVTSHQVVATYLAILAYMIMLANVALFCSVVSRQSNSASWRTGILIGIFLFGTPIAQWTLSGSIGQGHLDPGGFFASSATTFLGWLDKASIFSRLNVIMTTGFSESSLSLQVISNLAAAVLFFAFSWAMFDVCSREELPASPARGFFSRRRFATGLLSCGRVWSSPLIWKDFHFITGGKPMMLGKIFLYGLLNAFVVYIVQTSSWIDLDHEVVGGTMMSCMFVALLLEPALYAGRIFREESKWKTLSSLVLLPSTIPEIVYPKIAGCLIALVPAAAWFFLGLLIFPEGFFDTIEDILDEVESWFMIVQYIFFLHLVLYLSLLIKWGAAPLAFALVYVVNGFCLTVSFLGAGSGEEGVLVIMSFFGLFGTLILHFAIGERLRTLAAA